MARRLKTGCYPVSVMMIEFFEKFEKNPKVLKKVFTDWIIFIYIVFIGKIFFAGTL
jgi:hypothetical protein